MELQVKIGRKRKYNPEGKETNQQACSSLEMIIQKSFDEKIWKQLHLHQREGVKFLLQRLLSDQLPSPIWIPTQQEQVIHSTSTGAILADGMGTGKTLIGLVTLSILCRYLTCKAIIVCPSNLVMNWEREVQKWFGSSLCRNIVIVGSKSKAAKAMDYEVNEFITQHPLISPIIIMSYELYRIYAPALNTLSSLQILLCDEGHRYLKNLTTTKTGIALFNSIATRRIIFTGTIIQNNLKELYQMVQFIIPNYFQPFLPLAAKALSSSSASSSSLSLGDPFLQFKREFIDVIMTGLKENANDREIRLGKEKEENLQQLLAEIILKRHQYSILQRILPPIKTYLVLIPFLSREEQQYQQIIDASSLTLPLVLSSSNTQQIFAKLTELRVFTSLGSAIETEAPLSEKSSPITYIRTQSAKLQMCYAIIKQIDVLNKQKKAISKNSTPSAEKIVIISNYLSTLDRLKELCKLNQWSHLRIDGSVPMDKRYKMLDYFNNPTTNFFILLLSAKTGGIGINVTGGNHLILMEPDWNPANDEQSIGRIWRQGQTKAVTVYRLATKASIEEFICLQQMQKSQLNRVVQEKHQFYSLSAGISAIDDEEIEDRLPIGQKMKGMKVQRNSNFMDADDDNTAEQELENVNDEEHLEIEEITSVLANPILISPNHSEPVVSRFSSITRPVLSAEARRSLGEVATDFDLHDDILSQTYLCSSSITCYHQRLYLPIK